MTFHLCFMILVFFMVFVSAQHGSSTVIVEQGELEGKLYTSRNGAEYFGYLSIPFAKPPVGELRFEPPQPPDPWKGVRVATEKPPQCIQLSVFTSNPENLKPIGQEDCLYLNVFTPKQKTDLVPVMVFIHGGAFVEGSSAMYDTSYFMDHKIVTVTIQYRLSVFGFLSTRDNIVSGNNGMKDQVLALKWVQKNIAAFGGDPKRVTIFGESAGSGSVHYHLYSPLSKGLFHQAICQSGTSLDPWARIPRNLAYQQADALGVLTDCNTRDAKTFVKCLKKLPANELMMAHYKFYIWDLEPVIPFSVVLEEDVAGAFITRNPEFEKPVNDVPLIIGINQAEGGIKSARYLDGDGAKATYLNEHYERLFPIIFYYRSWIKDERRISEITQRLKKFYFGNKNIGTGTTHELTTLFTDGYFSYGSIEATHRYRKYNKVYFYYYDHRNKDTFCGILGKTSEDLGVCHGDDLFSLFYLDGFFPKITEGDDFQVSTRLVNYWVNFAYHGTPNDLWKPVESDNFEYLHITTKEDKMETHLIDERYQFWKSLKIDRNIDDVPAEKDETAEESTTSTLLIVVLIIAGIGIVTAVGVGLWFLCKRRNEIVHE